MTTLSLKALREVAEKATDGPWTVSRNPDGQPSELLGMFKGRIPGKVIDCGWGSATQRGQDDYAYIATFDPPTVKRLLDIAEAARLYCFDANVGMTDDQRLNLCAALRGIEP